MNSIEFPVRGSSVLSSLFKKVAEASGRGFLVFLVLPAALYAQEPHKLEIPNNWPKPELPADNPLTVPGVELGRRLFYDNALSRRNFLSCANCHEHHSAFSDQRKFSLGINGESTPRNSMPLFNLAYGKKFFWDGRVNLLREQALKPIQDPKEMGETLPNVVRKLQRSPKYQGMFTDAFGEGGITAERVSLAIEQFMLSIVSKDAKWDRVQRGEEKFTESEERGRALFFARSKEGVPGSGANCFVCHDAPLFTSNEFVNNGVDPNNQDIGLAKSTGKSEDTGKFKVPPLRNLTVTHRYMHDSRLKTLEDVVAYYNSGVKDNPHLDPRMKPFVGGLGLSDQQIQDLIAFLHTLTDQTFLKNKAYAKP